MGKMVNYVKITVAANMKTCLFHQTKIYRGSYMSDHVLLNLLNELGKEIKCGACRAFYLFFATSLIIQ